MEGVCALCGKRARMLCESDQAKLCWDCDGTVHGANFLVAKHVRVLLCRICYSPTPWKASGSFLTPTSSVCHRCVHTAASISHQSPNNHDHDDDDERHSFDGDDDADDDDDEYVAEEEEEEEEEEGENQVVPWSSSSSSPSEEVVVNGTSSGNNSDNDGDMSSNNNTTAFHSSPNFNLFNRFPNNIHHHYDDEEDVGCSSWEGLGNEELNSMNMLRPLKQPRISQREDHHPKWHNQRWGRTQTQD